MDRFIFWIARMAGAAIAGVLLVAVAAAAEREKRVVIPFDFVSTFDEGRYGEMVADMIWKKLERAGCFVIPETTNDVRNFCKAKNFKPDPDTDMAKMAQVVTGDFGAHVGIWGSVERDPGALGDIYDLVIKCVDFSETPPKVVYECKNRTNTVSEIPHLYVKNMMDKLLEREPEGAKGENPEEEEAWKKAKNLIVGGDFEKAVGAVPVGWEPVCGQQREPLGRLVQWLPEVGNEKNHVIRLTFDEPTGNSTGVMYYSKPFPVQEGAKYRFECRYRHTGCNVKVFIKCYDVLPSEYKRVEGKPEDESREAYRSQQNLKGPANEWNVQREDFTPKHTKYNPKFGRIDLYGYKGKGTIEFDDVVVKMIAPPPSAFVKGKEKRHSLETKVTMKEMDENYRRSNQLKAAARGQSQEKSESTKGK